MNYIPNKKILNNYAKIMINFALNNGEGIKKGETVFLNVPECAKPLLMPLYKTVIEAGANPIISYIPSDSGYPEGSFMKILLEYGSKDQINFFPSKYFKGIVDEADHALFIIATTDKFALKGVDPKKIMTRQKTMLPYRKWRQIKENAGKFTWTLGMYGTNAMAKEVNMSTKEYWSEIIEACYLDTTNPVAKWKKILHEVERVKAQLNALRIESLHVKSKDIDLVVKLGANRKWMGGSGHNIPSFEIFISPDYRGTEGYITFTEPLYRYGNLIKDVYLEFKGGKVVKVTASKGEKILKEMISTKGADQIGEFSLTDGRLSRITKFMGETLFDENVGGENGNTHIALGNAYQDSYTGDPTKISTAEWEKMGYNVSVIHTDIVSTANRVVTATLTSGETKVIYENGQFLV